MNLFPRELDERKGYFPIQSCVLGKVDRLLATLAEELFDLVAVAGERGWLGWTWIWAFASLAGSLSGMAAPGNRLRSWRAAYRVGE